MCSKLLIGKNLILWKASDGPGGKAQAWTIANLLIRIKKKKISLLVITQSKR